MAKEIESLLAGELLDDNAQVSMAQLCRVCRVSSQVIMALVDEGVVEPIADAAKLSKPTDWRFRAISVSRVRRAVRLEQDLGLNMAGIALALELLDELAALRLQLRDQTNIEDEQW
ncbi:MAG: chaperone modulator CbpM [Burkholderiaceae bacterium]